jgi:hypothetical protein
VASGNMGCGENKTSDKKSQSHLIARELPRRVARTALAIEFCCRIKAQAALGIADSGNA